MIDNNIFNFPSQISKSEAIHLLENSDRRYI